jgi:hypothetical protein
MIWEESFTYVIACAMSGDHGHNTYFVNDGARRVLPVQYTFWLCAARSSEKTASLAGQHSSHVTTIIRTVCTWRQRA